MRIRLTPRGFKLLAASTTLLILGAALWDPLLVASAIIIWAYISLLHRQTGDRIRSLGQVRVSPETITARLTAGQTYLETLHIDSPIKKPLRVSLPLTEASLTPDHVITGMNTLKLSYTPKLSGVYVSETLEAKTVDSLSLVEGSGEASFRSTFKVYPRVFLRAMEALELLIESGYAPEGDQPTRIRGRGHEYAESREYAPGDTMDVFDWKAMARTGKPFVKQFYAERGGGLEIVFDPVSPDLVSLDELNAALLELAVSAVRSGAPVKLSTVDGKGSEATSPRDVVEAALRIALEGHLEEFREYYALLEPSKTRHIDRILKARTVKKVGGEAEGQGNYSLVVLSSLGRDMATLLDLIRDRPGYSSPAVIQPTRPWVWAPDLEVSMRMLLDNRRNVRVLEKMRARTYLSVKEFTSDYRRVHRVEATMV